eukprot:11165018-Lingulodinium_polyedra.AAC.1
MARAKRAICEPLWRIGRLPPQGLANRTFRARHANTMFGVRMVCARRAMREPLWWQTVESTASLCSVSQPLHNDAVDST